MYLQPSILTQISESNRIKGLLAAEFNKTGQTIDNWIRTNSLMLITAPALSIIREETGLTDAEILTEQSVDR